VRCASDVDAVRRALFGVIAAMALNVASVAAADIGSHVRISDGDLRALTDHGTTRSETLRALLVRLDTTSVLVFVDGDWFLPSGVAGHTALITVVEEVRYVRVVIGCSLPLRQRLPINVVFGRAVSGRRTLKRRDGPSPFTEDDFVEDRDRQQSRRRVMRSFVKNGTVEPDDVFGLVFDLSRHRRDGRRSRAERNGCVPVSGHDHFVQGLVRGHAVAPVLTRTPETAQR
jgi:hypothetical protein